MATLIRDNHQQAFGAQQDSIAGVASNTGSHLVVVRQMTDWNNKEFVCTPIDMRYNQGWSLGQELYGNTQGGSAVYNDTNTLINNVRNSISTHGWKVGDCALFGIYSRTAGPYAWYQYYKHFDSTLPQPTALSEYGTSVVAYKFNLHHLHFSRMTSFQAYLRVWAPSLVFSFPPQDMPDDGILVAGGLYNNGSCLRVKFFNQLPTPAWDIAEGADSFEFAGNCNNGTVVSWDTIVYDKMCIYNPFGGDMAYSTRGNSSRIYTLQSNVYYDEWQHPTNYFHDFPIANSDNLDFLKTNPGEMWLVAHFHMGNAFSEGTNTLNGLNINRAATVYAERVELVFRCTSSRFNYN